LRLYTLKIEEHRCYSQNYEYDVKLSARRKARLETRPVVFKALSTGLAHINVRAAATIRAAQTEVLVTLNWRENQLLRGANASAAEIARIQAAVFTRDYGKTSRVFYGHDRLRPRAWRGTASRPHATAAVIYRSARKFYILL